MEETQLTEKLHSIRNYIKHCLQAKGRHCIHSPFLYDFYDNYVTKTPKLSFSSSIEGIRKQLLSLHEEIDINDLGAGSRIHSSSKRKISSIARTSLKSKKEAVILAHFCKSISAKSIIEMGTSLGVTTAYLAKVNPQAKIHSIEGCSTIADIARKNLRTLDIRNTHIHQGNFDDILPRTLNKNKAEVVIVDGNHTLEATLKYFEMILDKLNPDGFIIFDDIYWSKGMTQAWKQIHQHPRVSMSIDFFYIGIVSLSKDFTKQHFKLKM